MINKTSKKWNDSIIESINYSQLNLLRVYDNTFIDDVTTDILHHNNISSTCHCDFCGQHIKYVSILEFNKDSNITHYQIGKECLSYLYNYDMKINGLDHVKFTIESSVKKLINNASIRSRREKYKEEFKDELEWIDSLDIQFVMSHSFLSFIKHRLLTGEGIVTPEQRNYLLDLKLKITPESTKNISDKKRVLLDKTDALIDMIKSSKYYDMGTLNFVSSVRSYIYKYGNATEKQFNALNNIYKKLNEDEIELASNSNTNINEDIPW